VKTVVLGPPPAEIDALIARRRALGQDTHDEVWEGEYHVAPVSDARHARVQIQLALAFEAPARRAGLTVTAPFNLGTPDDFRVPDLGVHAGDPTGVWLDTAAIVVEVVSPHDETWQKFAFYAAHDVGEICVADPQAESLRWFVRRADGSGYDETEASPLLGLTCTELTAALAWPGR
jgi:Uma2 family endonuclease